MTLVTTYKILTQNRFPVKSERISGYIPNITKDDIQRGYINRYFIQKSNDINAPIFEITKKDYYKFSSSPLYSVTTLRWRITGPINPLYNKGKLMDMGIKQSNINSIKLASNTITKLKLYLPNLLQFTSV